MEALSKFRDMLYEEDDIDKELVNKSLSYTNSSGLSRDLYVPVATKRLVDAYKYSATDPDVLTYMRDAFEISKDYSNLKKAVKRRVKQLYFQTSDEIEAVKNKKYSESIEKMKRSAASPERIAEFESERRKESKSRTDLRNQMEGLISEYNLGDYFGAVRENPINKFLVWYNKMYEKSRYLTSVGTEFVGRTLADFSALATVGAKAYTAGSVAGMATALAYYGWEGPKINELLDKFISLDKESIPVRAHRIKTAANDLMQEKDWPSLKKFASSCVSYFTNAKRGAFYMFCISPLWTLRHMAVIKTFHGDPMSDVFSTNTLSNSMELWAVTLPFILPFEAYIQSKIPLQYRFLAQQSLFSAWQVAASVYSLS